jgi:hypothetical protein
MFLIVVALVSLGAGALTFYIGRHQSPAAIVNADNEDAVRTPLPSGPRKYQ